MPVNPAGIADARRGQWQVVLTPARPVPHEWFGDLPGATVEPTGELEQAFFSVNGRTVRIDGADVQVFEYVDEASRLAESSLIAPDGGSIGTTMVTWVDQPTFWAKGRLIVLYIGREAAGIEKLSGLLGDPITTPWPTP